MVKFPLIRSALALAVLCVLAIAGTLPRASADPPAEPVGRLDRDRAARVALAIAATTPATPPAKSVECRDRDARVALALSAPAVEHVVAIAPAPRPKSVAVCPCDNCKCAAGTCPACPAVTAPTTSPAKRLVRYERVCIEGKCYWVPVYEP